MRLRNAFKYSVLEASKLVSTKTLLLKHYYRRQGETITISKGECTSPWIAKTLFIENLVRGDGFHHWHGLRRSSPLTFCGWFKAKHGWNIGIHRHHAATPPEATFSFHRRPHASTDPFFGWLIGELWRMLRPKASGFSQALLMSEITKWILQALGLNSEILRSVCWAAGSPSHPHWGWDVHPPRNTGQLANALATQSQNPPFGWSPLLRHALFPNLVSQG